MKPWRWIAVQLARDAGKILMDEYGKNHSIEYKTATDYKTNVDDKVDQFLREKINSIFPEHSILSEESDKKEQDSEFTWVIDPLDGTFNYELGITDNFSVSIALVKNKEPIIGVVYAPKRDEVYVAEKGEGSFLNGKKIQSSPVTNVNKAILASDTSYLGRERILDAYPNLLSDENGVTYVFNLGASAMSMAMVAGGRLEGYISYPEPWDVAAGGVLVREAGGKVTSIEGKEWELGDESILAASNSDLYDKLFKLVNNI